MYTLEEIAALRQKCAELQLEGREILEKYSHPELQKNCNGIGPAVLPSFIRKTFTRLNHAMQAAAFIHDVEFEEADGTRAAFEAVNARFLANGLKVAEQYGACDPRRYLFQLQIHRLAGLCRRFGWICWILASRKN